ncbi:MAG: hypothetical protein GON13_00670 [Nanoarchaeota archaeon]|nr:hypothetical protein [Nanoarchaeota archaeon]
MVVESIINVTKARKKPILTVGLGFAATLISTWLAVWVFPSGTSLAVVFLTTMATLPLIIRLLESEEKKEERELKKRKRHLFIKDHKEVFMVYLYLFIGLMLGFTFLFIFIPSNIAEGVFQEQVLTINAIRGGTGSFVQDTNIFILILSNNLKVLFFCLLFSFIYGSGAIFILTWNASVISVAIGDLIRTGIANASHIEYFKIIPLSFGRYLFHGLPEIAAYFLAGIAGGIISTAIIRKQFNKKYFSKIVVDSLDLIVLAIILLFLAGLLEISISPLIKF